MHFLGCGYFTLLGDPNQIQNPQQKRKWKKYDIFNTFCSSMLVYPLFCLDSCLHFYLLSGIICYLEAFYFYWTFVIKDLVIHDLWHEDDHNTDVFAFGSLSFSPVFSYIYLSLLSIANKWKYMVNCEAWLQCSPHNLLRWTIMFLVYMFLYSNLFPGPDWSIKCSKSEITLWRNISCLIVLLAALFFGWICNFLSLHFIFPLVVP